MKYLLDVNALIALEHSGSPHHDTFHAWARTAGTHNLATCALVELGFIRVSMQVFGYTLAQSQRALADLKTTLAFVESAPAPLLDPWADAPSRTTDAYLSQIARKSGLRLATFDKGIPGSVLIR